MARPTILLFDIDGTLLDCGGAGRRAMERGFDLVHGRADAVSHIVFGGMTDPAIVRAGLGHIGIADSAAAIARVLEAYLEALHVEVGASPKFRILPHVLETLDVAAALGHFIGIGTGNLARGAALKLGHANLAHRFSFGGYACDAEERSEVLRAGRGRGVLLAGDSARVVVIGDTPHDVSAAHAIDAECLAVATGRFSLADLEAAGPLLAVPDLADPRAQRFLE